MDSKADCVTLYILGGGSGYWIDDSAMNCHWLTNTINNVLQIQ